MKCRPNYRGCMSIERITKVQKCEGVMRSSAIVVYCVQVDAGVGYGGCRSFSEFTLWGRSAELSDRLTYIVPSRDQPACRRFFFTSFRASAKSDALREVRCSFI